jgi:opacity protein-like surface antigen
MTNTPKTLLLLAALALPSLAHAQPGDTPPTLGEAATPDSAVPAPAIEIAAPAPTEPVGPTTTELADRVTGLETKLGGLEETQAATDASVNSLKKLKVSGYIQGRYEHSQASVDGLKSDGKTPTNADRFLVRRGRLKAAYEGKNAEYVLQIDATGDGVTLKDAEATFVDTWTPLNLRLTVGQFKVPFGYELVQSSGDREMPERSGIIKAYFDGERDRGLRLTARYEFLRLAIALINGNGVKDTSVYKSTSLFGTQDPNQFKDVVGRLGIDLGDVVASVSAYFGRGPMETTVKASSIAGDPPTITYDYMRRTRLGADLQGYIDVPGVGGLALKGEVLWGSEAAIDWHGVGSDPSKNVRKLGWIATAVQNIGDQIGVVVRVDQFDPNTAKDKDKVTTVGGGALYHVSSNLKVTLVYQHAIEEGPSVDNDILYTQLQAKF